jgi:RNA polymerase-interacting CarD/CdnL/TRCF family regulator
MVPFFRICDTFFEGRLKSTAKGGNGMEDNNNLPLETNTYSIEPPAQLSSAEVSYFQPGDSVIYGTLGRCSVIGIETKRVGNQDLQFYRVEIYKPIAAKTKKNEASILIPLNSARQKGLRNPIRKDDVESVFTILRNQEYYFSIKDRWETISPQLETIIAKEGAHGLAKALSYFHIAKPNVFNPPIDFTRTHENVRHVLIRELADAQEITIRDAEEQINKAIKNKILQDS